MTTVNARLRWSLDVVWTGDDRGIALVVVLMAISLLSALGLALTLTTIAEGKISGNFAQGAEALYAADAGIERAVQDLVALPDWSAALSGVARSPFVDGPPGGLRAGAGDAPFDLTAATDAVRCGKPSCNNADLTAITEERPLGINNPVWQPYAYGPLTAFLPRDRINSAFYVVVWVGDDPSENDADPLRDGGIPVGCDPVKELECADTNSGRGRLVIRATAYGPDGTQRTIEALIGRAARPRILAWREIR
jgi:Tfp pilus assembly protein PilX